MPRSRHVTDRAGRITSELALDHVSITVDDLAAAVEFYDAALGRQPPDPLKVTAESGAVFGELGDRLMS